MQHDLDEVFSERRRLLSLGYRMTGTLADAENIVQETYLRWYRLDEAERGAILNPAGWLTRAASRIALDLLSSARHRREQYVGQWLPEPVPADLFVGTASEGGASLTAARPPTDPADRITMDEAVGTALLVVLESMTPAERVAFVLHDVFGVPFDEIADVVGRSPAAVRQLATSARRHVREQRTSVVHRDEHDAAVRAFHAATRSGDLQALLQVLAPEVQVRTDGGGRVTAAPRPITGADRVARYLLGLGEKFPTLVADEHAVGDGLGLVLRHDETPTGVMSFRVEHGRITDVWIVLNPEKLTGWLPTP
jgi:RNA polymerase sigma-70 factor (ECF subfamily)